jgi:hypothetical protein
VLLLQRHIVIVRPRRPSRGIPRRLSRENRLDRAADDLAKTIGLLGIQAVLAVLFRGAKIPRTWRGGGYQLEPPPPRAPGMRYRPTIREDPTLPAGQGGRASGATSPSPAKVQRQTEPW